MNKDCLLYFSMRCQSSVELLKYLEKNRLGDQFLIINIDNPKFQIPTFVDRVPLIYRRSDRSVIIEDALETYITQLAGGQLATGQLAGGQLAGGGQPTEQSFNVNCYNEVVGGDNYGFIDEAANKQVYSSGHAYDYISNTGTGACAGAVDFATSNLSSENVNKGSRFDENSYKEYLMKRDMDISQIFSRQKRA
jgi:hypothetical protein